MTIKAAVSPLPDHYAGLDALRGVAALAVVGFHFGLRTDLPYLFQRGYLSVDFFFVLSGFVIARAYSDRISNRVLSVFDFYLLRIVRLMPLIVLGALIAFIVELFRPQVADQGRHMSDAVTALAFGVLLIPVLWETTLEYAIFPLNGPTWSLFFEVFANAVFAPVARFRFEAIAIPILLITGASLVWATWSFNSLDVGPIPRNFWLGFSRVGYSFTVGILLYRWRHHAPAVPFLVPLVLLVLLLLVPAFSHGNSGFDCVCVLAIMPGLVFLASRAQFGTVGRKLSTLSADWSYPMYALHYPMVRAMGLAERKLNLGIFPRLALAILGMTAVIMMSAAFYRYYDVPVRRFLTEYLRRWRLSPVRQP